MKKVATVNNQDTNAENNERSQRKTFIGIVSSTKMDKTIVVKVESKFSHPRIKKLVVMHKKFHAHDENNECKVGDKVKIIETKPYSKTKFFRLLTIMERAK